MSLQWCTCGHTLGVHDVSRKLPPPCSYASVCGCKGYEADPANDDKPAPPALTASEVALARILAAIEVWVKQGGHDGSAASLALVECARALVVAGFLFPGTGGFRDKAKALLDRARKAGVL